MSKSLFKQEGINLNRMWLSGTNAYGYRGRNTKLRFTIWPPKGDKSFPAYIAGRVVASVIWGRKD